MPHDSRDAAIVSQKLQEMAKLSVEVEELKLMMTLLERHIMAARCAQVKDRLRLN